MPKNIDFVLFHCKGTFVPERYLRRRLGYVGHSDLSNVLSVSSENECGNLDTLQGIRMSFVNTLMSIGHSLSECNSQVLIYSKLHEKNHVITY